MEPSRAPGPRLNQQPPTVDFIDNRLPDHHPAFSRPPVHYSNALSHYELNSQVSVQTPNSGDDLEARPSNALAPVVNSSSQTDHDYGSNHGNTLIRRTWTETKTMRYWNSIFPDSNARFRLTTEPSGRTKGRFDIRNKNDWDSIYEVLEEAQNMYMKESGAIGWLRKTRRKAGDNVTGIAELTKLSTNVVPNDPYATPILGVVKVLLDAVKTAAAVRKQVLSGFESLVPIFADVELFLGTYPRDESIRNASIELTATVLTAIERAIGFFVSNEFKGLKAVCMGSSYEAQLLQSLEMIKEKSTALMEEATKSHIHEFHMYSVETQKLARGLLDGQKSTLDGINSIHELLLDHVRQKDSQLEAARQELIYLRVENGALRTNSPSQQSPWLMLPQHQPQAQGWNINQEVLRQMIRSPDFDAADISFVLDKKELFPPRQRVQVEQIVNTQTFRDWIVAPCSTKLMVQWDSHLPKTISGVSPLSVFCAMMAQTLQARARFLPIVWFCGLHVDMIESTTDVGGRAMVSSLTDQLLKHHYFDSLPLRNEVDLLAVQRGELCELIRLLDSLIRRLPAEITLICVIDGIVMFEKEEFQNDALLVFSSLLAICHDQSISAAFKVLFATTPGTDIVRAAFEHEDLIINVDTLPKLSWAPSEERLARELSGI